MNKIISMLYPGRCPGCDSVIGFNQVSYRGFCQECVDKIIRVGRNYCMRCGKQIKMDSDEYCIDCKKKKHSFTEARTTFVYTGRMKNAMYRFKYANRRCYSGTFVSEMLRANGKWIKYINPDVIIPVPMYKKKQRKRGYNQAEVLAKELSKATGIPMEKDFVVRKRDTIPMKNLHKASQRKANLFDAFKINKNGVKFNRILLVDDIFTTGATFDNVAKVLQSYCKEVYCVSVCAGSDKTT